MAASRPAIAPPAWRNNGRRFEALGKGAGVRCPMEALTRGPLSGSDLKRRHAGRRQDEPQESGMPWDDGRDLIIVSDTHLSVSVDERTGVPGHSDDFFCDAALVRFLDNLRERARDHGRGVRL